MIEPLELARLQVISARKDQPLIAGKHHTSMFDLIQPHGFLDLAVKQQVTVLLFLVRPNLHEHQVADDRIGNLCVIEFLVRIVDRFGIDTLAGFGIVFDLDRQVSADGFDEDAVLDGDVWMGPVMMLVASGLVPAKSCWGG